MTAPFPRKASLHGRCTALGSILMAILLYSTGYAELIPAERLTDWTPGVRVGVIGGIPTNRTKIVDVTGPPFRADNTGATDATSAVQAAIDGAVPGDVIFLPAGTYRLDTSLVVGSRKHSITIRGAGSTTVLESRAATGIAIGTGAGFGIPWGSPADASDILSGIARGSTAVTIKDASAYTVGHLAMINLENDPTLPVFSVFGFDLKTDQAMRRQIVRITAKQGNVVSFFPPLYGDYGKGALKATLTETPMQTNAVGLEDFKIDFTRAANAIFGISFDQCYGSWIKNVHIKKVNNYNLYFSNSLNCEIRQCFLDEQKGSGTNGAGLLCNTLCASLVEDNIVYKSFPLFEINHSSCGNVFGYNFGEESIMGIDSNHGPHNSFNLYEGNVFPGLISDGYFGGESELTVFRNWFHAVGTGYAVSLKRFTRNASFVGNILASAISCGQPNIGNGNSNGTAQLSNRRPWNDWNATATLIKRTSGTEGVIRLNSGGISSGQLITVRWGTQNRQFTAGAVAGSEVVASGGGGAEFPAVGTELRVLMGPSGYQELDLDVEATLIKKGNLYTDDGRLDSNGGDPLPVSLYRGNVKPAWFGDRPWPALDPKVPGTLTYDRIPAGYRFQHGKNPPSSIADEVPPTIPQNLACLMTGPTTIELNWLPSSDNIGVAGYRLERSKGDNSTTFSQIATPSGTSFADTGLTASTVYNYRIRAVDGAGNLSGYSNVVTTTTAAIPPPKSPSNLRIKAAQ